MAPETREITAAVTVLERCRPFTRTDEALADLLRGIVQRHRPGHDTPEHVAFCACGGEWTCRDVADAQALAAAIVEAGERDA